MALKKKIKMPNGLELEYHKISLVNIQPNQQITILCDSYLNEEARQYEKDYAAGLIENPVFPYMASEYYNMNYSENIDLLNGDTMTCAYDLLKQACPKLEGAENV